MRSNLQCHARHDDKRYLSRASLLPSWQLLWLDQASRVDHRRSSDKGWSIIKHWHVSTSHHLTKNKIIFSSVEQNLSLQSAEMKLFVGIAVFNNMIHSVSLSQPKQFSMR
jgi:hypothetical protein